MEIPQHNTAIAHEVPPQWGRVPMANVGQDCRVPDQRRRHGPGSPAREFTSVPCPEIRTAWAVRYADSWPACDQLAAVATASSTVSTTINKMIEVILIEHRRDVYR